MVVTIFSNNNSFNKINVSFLKQKLFINPKQELFLYKFKV